MFLFTIQENQKWMDSYNDKIWYFEIFRCKEISFLKEIGAVYYLAYEAL